KFRWLVGFRWWRQRLWFRWRRMERLHRSLDGLHHLRFVRRVGLRARNADVHVAARTRPITQRAEKHQAPAKDDDEQNQLAGPGLEEIEEVARFHGLIGVCLALGAFEGVRPDRPVAFCDSAIARRRAWRARASRSG